MEYLVLYQRSAKSLVEGWSLDESTEELLWTCQLTMDYKVLFLDKRSAAAPQAPHRDIFPDHHLSGYDLFLMIHQIALNALDSSNERRQANCRFEDSLR